MKKLISILLAMTMLIGMCACGSASAPAVPRVDPAELHTINDIKNAGCELTGWTCYENVFMMDAMINDEEYLALVPCSDEQFEATYDISYEDEDVLDQYLALFGDSEFLELIATSAFEPSEEEVSGYVGMTIGDFETMYGFECSGYIGGDGEYAFFFDNESFEYRVELADDVKLEDYDDIDMFNAAISDYPIDSIEFMGISSLFWDRYVEENYYEGPEAFVPPEIGEVKSSLEEINSAAGCALAPCAIDGVTNESYSLVNGNVACYTFVLDGIFCRAFGSSDLSYDIGGMGYDNSPLLSEDGYYTMQYKTTDNYNGVRFMYDGVQYEFIVFAGSDFDYTKFTEIENAYRTSIYSGSLAGELQGLDGTFSDVSGAGITCIPVTSDTIQFGVYSSYTEEDGMYYWSMLVKDLAGRLVYDKSTVEHYTISEATSEDAGSGYFDFDGSAIRWTGAPDPAYKEYVFVAE